MGRLRVMTYNVKGLTLDRDALVAVVRAAAPDVVGLHLGRTRRGFAVARVDGVTLVVLHLALNTAERARHLDRILAEVARAAGPCVVVGDLNEAPGGPSWLRLTGGLRDAVNSPRPTFTAQRPRHRLDAVLVSPEVRVLGSHVPDDDAARRASDHMPVVVDLAT